jgi:hypothetical protein
MILEVFWHCFVASLGDGVMVADNRGRGLGLRCVVWTGLNTQVAAVIY